MKKIAVIVTCMLLAGISISLQAQIISVTSGTDFNIAANTVIAADSMDITPASDFTINGSSLVRSNVVNNSTSFPYINRVYQFSQPTNAFNGALKVYYNNGELNGMPEAALKTLYHNNISWQPDPETVNNSTNNTVESSVLNATALKEITASYFAKLQLKAFLEGFYLSSGLMRSTLYDLEASTDNTATDSVEINLWSTANLSNPSPNYSSKGILHNDGNATLLFSGFALDSSYYIQVKHRNSVAVWSASPISVASTTDYDFTNSLASAYGDGVNPSMKLKSGGKYAMYSGDINQDGGVDILDMQQAENDASKLSYGYNSSDCNGDKATDILDMQLIENNASLFLYTAKP